MSAYITENYCLQVKFANTLKFYLIFKTNDFDIILIFIM